jgi:2-keto-4-pentenoate hydratase
MSAVDALAGRLFDAFETGTPIDPPIAEHPDMTVEDAYAVQRALVALHAAAGRSVRGRKIGLTSAAMRSQLGVEDPDFGVLLDSHIWEDGATLSMSGLHAILPRLEGEIGFVLRRPLAGRPGAPITADEVRDATEHVLPVFEVIDSRVKEWRIGLMDTVSDNASCLGAVLGAPVPLDAVGPLPAVALRFSRDDAVVEEGTGDAVMGDPAEAVAWLANELGRLGDELPAHHPILSGSLTAAVPADPGRYTADFGPALGAVTVEITS